MSLGNPVNIATAAEKTYERLCWLYSTVQITLVLGPSKQVIGDIMGRAFEKLAPPAAQVLVTLFWVRELQRIEVALQNKMNQDPDAVHACLIVMMQTKMVDYFSFVKVRESLSISTNVWEKTFCRVYLEFSYEFTNQLIYCQLRTIRITKARGLADRILWLLFECIIWINCW